MFTGLSGAGKSTLAKAVMAKLLEYQQKTVTLLDGDIIRKHLSSELGFSKKDRDTHLQRMGYVASEITKHKGVALCAAIAPYADTRQVIRHLVNQYGGFIEVYVSTPLTICKQRDIKGLYQKAEAGLISGFTGIDAPYQAPTAADVIIDTSICTVQDAVLMILSVIEKQGYAYQSKTITP